MQIFSILKEQLLLSIPVPPDSFTSASSSSSSSANTTIGAPYWEPVAVKQDWRLKWRESCDAERGYLVGEMRAGDADRWRDAGWRRHLTRREEESWGRDEGNNKQTGWKQIKLLSPNAMSHVDMCSVEGRLKFCQITHNKGYEIFEGLCCYVWFVCNSSHSSNRMRKNMTEKWLDSCQVPRS